MTQTPSAFTIGVGRDPDDRGDAGGGARRAARRLGAGPPRHPAADPHPHPQLSCGRRGPRRTRQPPVLRRPHRVAALGGQLPRARQHPARLRRRRVWAARRGQRRCRKRRRRGEPGRRAGARPCAHPAARVAHGHHREPEARCPGAAGGAHRSGAARPELHEFILGDRAEPFTVATIEQAVAESRDRVIFSIGYGRTPHGRVLSDFGALGASGRRAAAGDRDDPRPPRDDDRHLLRAERHRRGPDAVRRGRAGRDAGRRRRAYRGGADPG